MANQITAAGISIDTYQDTVDEIINGATDVPGLITIYGADINVDSNTPDGQWVNIFALAKQDILNLCVQIYNSMNPDVAVGIALDRLCALNGIVRQGGTYTEVVVTVNVTGSFNLNGLDTTSPYTVSDNNGNLFYLIETSAVTSGDNSLNFRSATIGFVQILSNVLTVPVTIIAGVNSVNNPTTPYQVGQNQETDSALRLRRQSSTAVPSQGFNNSLFGGLNTIADLTQAVIYENVTGSTDAHGVPGHSIWVIANGGSDEDISEIIYRYRNAGCGMYGSTTVNVNQADGTTFPISFTRAAYQNLYISVTVSSLSGGSIDTDALKTAIVNGYTFDINEIADTTALISVIHAYSSDLLVTFAGVSNTAGSYLNSKATATLYNIWQTDTSRIAVAAV